MEWPELAPVLPPKSRAGVAGSAARSSRSTRTYRFDVSCSAFHEKASPCEARRGGRGRAVVTWHGSIHRACRAAGGLRASLHRIGPFLEAPRVVSLAPDCPGERADHIISASQAVEDIPEIDARPPAEFGASTMVDVDTIYPWEHSPAALPIQLLVVGEQASNHARCIRAEPGEVLRPKRACCTHDVATEPDLRSSLSCEDVCINGIGEVQPSVQVLVHLEIEIIVLPPKFGIVVRFRKETRGPQHDAWQAGRPEEQLAEILGRLLRHPVDIPRNGIDAFIDPGGGLTIRGPQGGAEGTRRAAEDHSGDAGGKRGLEDSERSRDVRLDEGLP